MSVLVLILTMYTCAASAQQAVSVDEPGQTGKSAFPEQSTNIFSSGAETSVGSQLTATSAADVNAGNHTIVTKGSGVSKGVERNGLSRTQQWTRLYSTSRTTRNIRASVVNGRSTSHSDDTGNDDITAKFRSVTHNDGDIVQTTAVQAALTTKSRSYVDGETRNNDDPEVTTKTLPSDRTYAEYVSDITADSRVVSTSEELAGVTNDTTEGSTPARVRYVDRARCANGSITVMIPPDEIIYIANIRTVTSASDAEVKACKFYIKVPLRYKKLLLVESLGAHSHCGHFEVYNRFHSPLIDEMRELFSCTPPVRVVSFNLMRKLVFRYFFPAPQLARAGDDQELSLDYRLTIKAIGPKSGALTIGYLSQTTGYLALISRRNQKELEVVREVVIPEGHVVMASYQKFSILCRAGQTITLSVEEANGTVKELWTKCFRKAVPATVVKGRTLRFTLYARGRISSGFDAIFSLHSEQNAPTRLGNLFNCSVPHYGDFRQHLDCNLEKECSRGEDETSDCAFSGPACPGLVVSRYKCYFFLPGPVDYYGFDKSKQRGWNKANDLCKARGGRLASPRTEEELRDFLKLPLVGKRFMLFAQIGLSWRRPQVPFMYRNMFLWADGTALYYEDFVEISLEAKETPYCGRYLVPGVVMWSPVVELRECSYQTGTDVICEADIAGNSPYTELPLPALGVDWSEIDEAKYASCPDGHVTHNFLRCDPKAACGQKRHENTCPFQVGGSDMVDSTPSASAAVGMFQCEDGDVTIPYSLVCDFRPDCKNKSDETWCFHPPCAELQCDNGQCLSFEQRHDEIPDCVDHSDLVEDRHTDPILFMNSSTPSAVAQQAGKGKLSTLKILPVPPPALINFDGKGFYRMETLPANASCPETHYRCASEPAYCLPVYTRCNGINDCLDYRDEKGCRDVRCPGFYRCRASSVCVHVTHLCDGWPQCPQRDDELLCDVKCPPGCLCQGHAFLCRRSFSAWHFHQLRYLDATDSGMSPSRVSHNVYLVVLKLRNCSSQHLPLLALPNLQQLDLTDNLFTQINMTVFLGMPKLKTLSLAGNPLASLIGGETGNPQLFLAAVDVSRTKLKTFGSRALSMFPNVERLFMSSTPLQSISDEGFSRTPSLSTLDMKWSYVNTFPATLFYGLTKLQVLYVTNFRLCCPDILPQQAVPVVCEAPPHPLSSCERLLGYKTFQVVFWLVAALSVAGNAACLLVRWLVYKDELGCGFGVLVTNLNAANLLMGLYALVVAAADAQYSGHYRRHEVAWKTGAVCKLAGFSAALSTEVSAMVVCLITVDRFAALRAPRCSVRFGKRAAALGCTAAWFLAAILAALPSAVFVPRWDVHSLSGLCVALPFAKEDLPGRDFFFGIRVVFRLLQSLPLVAGHVVILRAVHKDLYVIDPSKKSPEAVVARRTSSMVSTDAAVVIATSLLGIVLTAQDDDVPAEDVSVIFAAFVQPVNSVLNPFLYLLKRVKERRRKDIEERLLALLKSRASAAALKQKRKNP